MTGRNEWLSHPVTQSPGRPVASVARILIGRLVMSSEFSTTCKIGERFHVICWCAVRRAPPATGQLRAFLLCHSAYSGAQWRDRATAMHPIYHVHTAVRVVQIDYSISTYDTISCATAESHSQSPCTNSIIRRKSYIRPQSP